MASTTCACSSTATCVSSSSSREHSRELVAQFLQPWPVGARARRQAHHGGRRGGGLRAGRPAILGRGGGRSAVGRAPSQRRQADGLQSEGGERNAASRLRRAERARGYEGAPRQGGREAPWHGNQGRRAARGREPGNAVFSTRARSVSGSRWPAGAFLRGKGGDRCAGGIGRRRPRDDVEAHA